jgi:hypothetical protein
MIAMDDPGMAPWITLMQSDLPPEVVLRQCREIIDRKASQEEHDTLLVVSQILAGLRYDEESLLSIFGGKDAMIESPVLQRLLSEVSAQAQQRAILTFLRRRFGSVPSDLAAAVQGVMDEQTLEALTEAAADSPTLEAFRSRVPHTD